MKKFIFSLAVVVAAASMSIAQKMTFETSEGQGDDPQTWNYGTIENGSDGVRYFNFKNTGDKPLIISMAKGSCGCTVPTWPREPIAPGATSQIKVKYDTKRTGSFTKYVTLTSNDVDTPTTRLKIFGTVNAPKNVNNAVPQNSNVTKTNPLIDKTQPKTPAKQTTTTSPK